MNLSEEKLLNPLTDADIEKFLDQDYSEYDLPERTKNIARDFLRAVKRKIPYEPVETLHLRLQMINCIHTYTGKHGMDGGFHDLWNEHVDKISFTFLRVAKWNPHKAYKLYEELDRIIETNPREHKFDELINE